MNIVALRLNLEDTKGVVKNLWQFDEDVHFSVDDHCKAKIHVRVNQHAEVDTIARPAVYKDE